MSYNITFCKVKKLNNLRIPRQALAKMGEELESESCTVLGVASERLYYIDCYIEGTMENATGDFLVKELVLFGDGSGALAMLLEEDILPNSTGELEVVRVWEGGEIIDKLICTDGKVAIETVEL